MLSFLKSFVALFVAIDVVGVLPFLFVLIQNLNDRDRRNLINRATFYAFAIGITFLFVGRQLFSFLGINESDFKVAGGLLLMIFAIRDLLDTHSHQGAPAPARVGIVPIAIPLMMGPASLTTLLITSDQYGAAVVVASLIANLALVWILFRNAHYILRLLGNDTSEAVNKIFCLLMAAIGVMFVRSGVFEMIAAAQP